LDLRVVVEPGVVDVTEVTLWRERAERAEERLAAAEARIEELAGQVAVLSRMLFGRSSEKTATGEPSGSNPQEGEQAAEGVGGRSKPKRGQQPGSVGHGRRDYSHLESREEIHDVAPEQRACPDCGRPFEALGFEGGERIDWSVTITRIVHRHKRYRRACACPADRAGPRTVTAPPAPRPIAKGLFTAGFLARLLFSTYVLGQPVTRIVKHLAAEGLDVAEGTLAGNLKALADLLEPLETAIRARTAAVHVHADETTWRVYEQTEPRTGHTWWLWVFIAEDTIVFQMADSRSTTVAAEHLGIDAAALESGRLPDGRRLLLSTDFYAAYQCLARLDGVDPLWCWAHIRRYFVRSGDAHPYLRGWSDAWVARIGDLYLAHRAIASAEPATPEHVAATAAFEAALTIMDTTRQAQGAHPDLLHPAAAKVLATLDREWDGLARHRDYPDLPLDNNTSEHALRTPVVGRKNYYGSHAEWSAHLAARVWTITATAERHGLEPLTYLTDYLNACATNGSKPLQGQALDQFLPWTPGPTGSRDHDPPQINPAD
jgi:transposase